MARSGQAFFVVGHANWGKSSTLKALTGGSYRIRQFPIGGRRFFIRRMSNDDRPHVEWVNRINDLRRRGRTHLILALCPEPGAYTFLRQLGGNYALHFWVMRHSFTTPDTISNQEIAALRSLGVVHVFN